MAHEQMSVVLNVMRGATSGCGQDLHQLGGIIRGGAQNWVLHVITDKQVTAYKLARLLIKADSLCFIYVHTINTIKRTVYFMSFTVCASV